MYNLQGDSGGPFTHKQGNKHVLIGVTGFGTARPVDTDNINTLSFEELLGWQFKCGEVTAFCKVSDPGIRDWLEVTLEKMGAENCHYGYDAN